MQVLGMLWGAYFDGQVFIPHDPKMQVSSRRRNRRVSIVCVTIVMYPSYNVVKHRSSRASEGSWSRMSEWRF